MQTPPYSLTPFGKRVLITGGNRGIGLGVAEMFASVGCDVVIGCASDPKKGAIEALRLASEFGIKAYSLNADVGDSVQARNLVREASRLLGGLDIVVCNSGICKFKPIMEVTDEEWHRHMDTNLNGTFYVAQEAARIMISQGNGGRLIFTTSVGSFGSNGTQTHYCATKGGQHLLMQGMALELAPLGITVNSVAPGWIHTDINHAASINPSITEPWLKAHCPVGRLGAPNDLAGAYLLLGSKEGAYINGSTITVDGGWMAQL